MKKQEFLKEIKQAACMRNSAASAVWPVAVEAAESDPRWAQVSNQYDDCARSFAKIFKVNLPQVQRKDRQSPVERLEKLIARAREDLKHVENPEWIEQILADIENMEGRLAKFRAEESA